MWYTKVFNNYSKATVTVEADSQTEAEHILTDWLSSYENNVVFTETIRENTDKCDYWMSLPQNNPFEKADITIEKPKKSEKVNDRVDLSMYVFEDAKIRHSFNYHKLYKNIDPAEFLALIKDWSKNFNLKVDKCCDGPDEQPVIRILATQKPEFVNKVDVNYVEVK